MQATSLVEEPLLECLEPLVGLSREGCPCYTLPSDSDKLRRVTTSTSGLYIDEDDGFNLSSMLVSDGCGPSNVWDRLLRAREYAIADVVEQIGVQLSSGYVSRVDKSMLIGEQSYSSTYVLTEGYYFFQIHTANYPGATIHINKATIMARLEPTVMESEVTIQIRNVTRNKPLAEYTIPITNKYLYGSYQPNSDLQHLPDDGFELYCDGSTYEIGFDYTPGEFRPVNNRLACVTCVSSQYDILPFFDKMPDESGYGIVLNARLYCNPQYLACAISKNKLLRKTVADLILARTIAIFVGKEMSRTTGKVTAANVLNANNLGNVRDSYNEFYLAKVAELVSKYPLADTYIGCFQCRPNQTSQVIPVLMGNYYDEDDEISSIVQSQNIISQQVNYPNLNDFPSTDMGTQGPQGVPGPEGPQGQVGPVGPIGPKGDTGLQGIQGIAGPKGDTGSQGIQGIQGLKGDTGDTGLTGAKGDKGDTGNQGIQGIQGIQGPQGPAGANGTNGTNGTNASAVLAVNTYGASSTGVLADENGMVLMNVATANTYTVPPNSSVAFTIGKQINVTQLGAGQTSIVAGAGVIISSAGNALKARVQYSTVSLIKIGTDAWLLVGDLTN